MSFKYWSENRFLPWVLMTLLLSHLAIVACSKSKHSHTEQKSTNKEDIASDNTGTELSTDREEQTDQEYQKAQALKEEKFPLHGLVTGMQLRIRSQPNPDSLVLGWLRIGSRIRLAPDSKRSATCNSGWFPLYPRGWACKGEGIEIDDEEPKAIMVVPPPARDASLPYEYYFVKDQLTPEFHRLPTREEQRAAAEFAQRYRSLLEENENRAALFWEGQLPNEPTRPAVVFKYLDRGFFVAGSGIETRSARKFVRTVRGRYIKLAQLENRKGSSFRGVELDDTQTLPVAWAIRTARPFVPRKRDDGSLRLVADQEAAPIERLSRIAWVREERVADRLFHVLEDGNYLKHWFVAVAKKIAPPQGVAEDEPWVHIDVGQQTLVLYQGARPVYASLVSTGLEGHDTPIGVFKIREKHVAETMSDLGPEAGDDRYKIEDVPWTQYFDKSIALHGAFWHERFGLRRSHGCINLSPADARRTFEHTLPKLPEGWHGISTDRTGFKGSTVVVTN